MSKDPSIDEIKRLITVAASASEKELTPEDRVLQQIIKIERECLYGDKSSRGKRKEIMALISAHADKVEAVAHDS